MELKRLSLISIFVILVQGCNRPSSIPPVSIISPAGTPGSVSLTSQAEAGKTIVAVMPDAGERYLSTALFEGMFEFVEKMAARP